jgi:chemotaxis protein histidine kinase CheA
MNDDAGNPFAELLEEYVAECAPLAQAVGDTLVTLERRWEEGDPADQLFGTLKGSLHTLKGNSAMMGLTAIQALAHCLEDVCAFLGERPDLRPAASGLLLRGAGVLVEMVGRAAGNVRPVPRAAQVRAPNRLGGGRAWHRRSGEHDSGRCQTARWAAGDLR